MYDIFTAADVTVAAISVRLTAVHSPAPRPRRAAEMPVTVQCTVFTVHCTGTMIIVDM